MDTGRLLRLAKHLDGLPAKNFDLDNWACVTNLTKSWEDYAEVGDNGELLGWKRATCGYTACAVGHAASIREFRNSGFHIILDGASAVPRYGPCLGWGAVRAFFDLDTGDADYLFSGDKYHAEATPRDVASRIREVVARFTSGHTVLT